MIFYKIFLFLMTTSLFASCVDFDGGARMGYRQDQHRYKLFDVTNESHTDFKESFNRIRAFQVEGFGKLKFWFLEAGVDADFAWVESGDIRSTLFVEDVNPTTIPAKFRSDGAGELWDIFGTGGARIPVHQTCCSSFDVTAIGGYGYNYQSLDRKDTCPDALNLGSVDIGELFESDPTLLSLGLSHRLKRTWKGPFAGVNISYCNPCFHTYAGYAYHWAELTQTLKLSAVYQTFVDLGMFNTEGVATFRNKNRFQTKRNRGHRAWATFAYKPSECSWVGLHGTYYTIKTSKKDSKNTDIAIFETLNPSTPPNTTTEGADTKMQASFQSFTVMLEMAFQI